MYCPAIRGKTGITPRKAIVIKLIISIT